jgi:two-component system sensor histidine kinase HydH
VVLLRVGLDATLLQDLQDDIHRRTLLRLLLTAISLGLIMAILMAWQRQRVLHREVRKISRELRRQEEETRRSEKLAAMGHLAAGVAHEIRNPLNTIHLIAQKLGRSPQLDDPLRLKADQIRDESRRIEGIVRQFLEFARPRDPLPVDLDLAEVVCATVAVHRSAHPEERLQVSCEAPEKLPAHLDHDMVVEVVDNLVRNAIEAQPTGGAVRVLLLQEGDAARIHIQDEGPGIPEADRARIFDLYFTTKPEGSGLGLSLVARMVSAMGGHLELEETQPGAHFVVTLPLRRSKT